MSDGSFVCLLCCLELAGAFGMDVARNLMEGIEKIGNPEDQCSFFVNVISWGGFAFVPIESN